MLLADAVFDYLIVSLIFFFLGRFTSKPFRIADIITPEEKKREKLIKKAVKKITTGLGPVKRPTAADLRKKDTKEEETEQAMTETLEKIVK